MDLLSLSVLGNGTLFSFPPLLSFFHPFLLPPLLLDLFIWDRPGYVAQVGFLLDLFIWDRPG